MKILLVLTGGTICSSKNENGLNDLNTGMAVPSLVSMYEGDAEFEVLAPINTLSENMTIEKWNQLIDALKQVNYNKYSGVIILHGTDTLHMTAALMGILLRNIGIPVMMVSAHRILEDPESNGPDNFNKSVSMIERLCGESGVYVVYRNMDGISYVHHAAHLEECGDYSEEFFSRDMISYDRLIQSWDEEWLNAFRSEVDSEMATIDTVGKLKDDVLYIKPYVGINYDRFSLNGVRAVLHNMYHSSTANSETLDGASLISLISRCNDAGIPVYLFPCNNESYRYSSTKLLIDAGAKTMYGGTWESAYIKLLIQGS